MTILKQQKPVQEQALVAKRAATAKAAAAAPNAKVPSAEKLLDRYRRKRSSKIRNILVERYRPQVEAIARTLALRLPPCVDVQDLMHAGLWGLMQAVDNFRPERGSLFYRS